MFKKPDTALFAGMLLGLCSFWNGAAVIACLLILMGFAFFSDGKLDYLILAIVTVVFSEIQSKMFVWGSDFFSARNPKYTEGDTTLPHTNILD